jgi:hypothetical protein
MKSREDYLNAVGQYARLAKRLNYFYATFLVLLFIVLYASFTKLRYAVHPRVALETSVCFSATVGVAAAVWKIKADRQLARRCDLVCSHCGFVFDGAKRRFVLRTGECPRCRTIQFS